MKIRQKSNSYFFVMSFIQIRLLLLSVFIVANLAIAQNEALAQAAPADSVAFNKGHAEAHVTFERPLKGSERGLLTRAGVRFVQVVAGSTYLVKLRELSLEALENHPLFIAIRSIETSEKLSNTLRTGKVPSHAHNKNGTISVNIRFYDDVQRGRALQILRKAGVSIGHVDHMLFPNRVIVKATSQQIDELTQSVSVESIYEIPPPPKTYNANSQTLINADIVQAAPFNLDGTGVLMGLWDGGPVRVTHQDLTPRVVLRENDTGQSFANRDHATHVSGTMVSSGAGNANAEGLAPNAATLFSWDFANGDSVTEQCFARLGSQACIGFPGFPADNIVISNHSWGSIVGWDQGSDTGNTNLFGAYTGTTSDWDELVRDTGLIVVKAAANDRNDCNPADNTDCDGVLGADGQRYDTIPERGNAKNVITVGSVGVSNGTGLSGFSSSGPTDDGRIKPDVVADGDSLISTCIDTTETLDNFYCNKGGTSMSTPSTSGASALLVERYRDPANFGTDPSPDIIKALWVNTATDLGRPGPDYLFGHGLIDALRAVDTIDAGGVRIVTDAVDQGDVDEYLVSVPADVVELRATLNWIDPEGGGGANPAIVNDLDVEAIGPDSTTNFPWTGPTVNTNNATATAPNSVDTVEHVSVANPDQGFWTVNVRGSSVPDGPQNYALVVNGLDAAGNIVAPFGFFLEDEPDIRVNAALDFDDICPGGEALRKVTIFNIGGADLFVNSVSVSNTSGPEDAFSLLPEPTQPVLVHPGAHVDFTVEFAASQPGFFEGELTILSNDPDQPSLTFSITGRSGEAGIDTLLTRADDTCPGEISNFDLTISNPGSCTLIVSGITDDAPFSVASVMTFPVEIAPGDSLAVPLNFAPASDATCNDTTDVTGTLTIFSNAPMPLDEKDVLVRGLIPCPDLNLAIANSGDFGEVCKGDHADLDLTLFNQGKCDLTISNIEILPDPGSFELPANLNLPLVLSHDADFTLPIRFAPEECSDIAEMRVVKITSDDPDEMMVEIPISGISPCPNLVIDPADLTGLFAFPTTVVDTTGSLGCFSERSVTLRNNGGCPLTIDSISASGADYSVTAPTVFPVILPEGEETLEVTVRFTPQSDADPLAPSEVMGLLTIVSDDPDFPQTADLCGESAAQSGVRILVTDISSGSPVPVDEVDSLTIQSKGKNRPSPINLQFTDQALNSTAVCGNDVDYHVDQETLPSTATTGSNPKSSYKANAREGNLQASHSFNLGQCDFLEFQLELQDSDAADCLLLAKGDPCVTDGECCSGNCKGPAGGKTCK